MDAQSLGEQNLQNLNSGENRETDNRQPKPPSAFRGAAAAAAAVATASGSQRVSQNALQPIAVPAQAKTATAPPKSVLPLIQDVVQQPESPMLAAAATPGRPLGENWQTQGATVRERNAFLFNNELMSDVKFLVGPLQSGGTTPGAMTGAGAGASLSGQTQQRWRIPAHKFVLASGSSVFFAMFFGDLAENQPEITIPDVEPQAFLTLLK